MNVSDHQLYLASVYVHILAAALWLGGMGFLVLVVVPILRMPAQRAQAMGLIESSGARFRTVGWSCFALLLLTGTYNASFRAGGLGSLLSLDLWQTRFGVTLAHKLCLVALILVVSAVHDFWLGPLAVLRQREAPEGPQALRLRGWARRCGRLTLVLALVVVGLAVVLVRG